jgi:Flp pilus assembly protein TadG
MKIGFGCTPDVERQRGQVLPIAAAAFLVMCALAGLAIDASRDYLVKRNAQNAVDFAVLAAAKQMTNQGSLGAPLAPNSAAVHAAHDFTTDNGFSTNYNNGCDSSSPSSFNATWFDVPGTPCGATTGFNTKVTINSPPVNLPGSPVPLVCQGTGGYSCVQVMITTRVAELFTNVLGIQYAYVTVAAAAQAILPTSTINVPPPNALLIYQPQAGCNPATQQCFDETKPVARALLSCTGGTNNCPTFWARQGTAPLLYGFDGSTLSPSGDYDALQSNGDMVMQDRTTICDPYNGGACAKNAVVGAAGFAVPGGTKLYCSKFGTGAAVGTPCTTTGQSNLNEIDSNQTTWSLPFYWYPTVDTSGLKYCGGLVLNGQAVYGPCSPKPSSPYSIEPGIYDYIVINHGTYEFDQGLFDITGVAPVNTAGGAGYFANGIDHSKEAAADFDLCTGGSPTGCPTLTAGVWFGHGGGTFGAYVNPVKGACTGSGSGSDGGGGDPTIITGSNVVFRLESSSGGFVSTHEVTSLALAGAGVGSQTAVGGSPLLIDEENSSFIHLDGGNPSTVQGIIYQTPNATGGGFEFNPGMSTSGANPPAITGQVLAYTFTTFGQVGNGLDFRNGYGTGAIPSIPTSGKNETEIISSVSLTAAAGQPGYSTFTVNYSDEWMMDAYDVYVKINNGSPQFFSQGIWSTTPNPGDPLPPPNNNPGDSNAAYPSAGAPGAYNIISANSPSPNDWSYTIPGGSGATMEAKGQWTWGHQNDIAGANSGSYTAQLLYTFPNPEGAYLSITLFVLDGDHCGDYAYANYTFKNTGFPGPGQQTVGSVSIVG